MSSEIELKQNFYFGLISVVRAALDDYSLSTCHTKLCLFSIGELNQRLVLLVKHDLHADYVTVHSCTPTYSTSSASLINVYLYRLCIFRNKKSKHGKHN